MRRRRRARRLGARLEKRRKGVFCGAGLEVIVGFSIVDDYLEAWESGQCWGLVGVFG